MLEVEGIRYSYRPRSREVLQGVSFTLDDGEILCLLGSNGTGKTTLLRCMLGFEKPKAGSITVNGLDMGKLSIKQRAHHMAYVPQYSSLAFPYTAREVVLMGRVSHLQGASGHSGADTQAADEALERLQVTHLANKRYQEMSGGEKQMVLVARALAQQAKTLVMDEPTANLDYHNQVKILAAIKHLAGEGLRILMTSHYPDHAFLACSTVALMSAGRIQKLGKPDDVVTSESLTELYDTPVCVTKARVGNEWFKTCIPLLDGAAMATDEPE